MIDKYKKKYPNAFLISFGFAWQLVEEKETNRILLLISDCEDYKQKALYNFKEDKFIETISSFKPERYNELLEDVECNMWLAEEEYAEKNK